MKEAISLEIKQPKAPTMSIRDTKIIDGTGENGATFYPSVSADGIISWTNNKGLDNPDPVNIKGKEGVDGKNGVDGTDGFSPDISVAEIPNGHRVTITDKDSVEHIDILNGDDGQNGADGVGIKSVEKTATNGEFDTYTFNFTDGKTFSFTIKNGKDGEDGADGRGISSIAKSSTNGLIDNYTINFTDGSKTTFSVTNGKNGVDGTDGKDGTPATHEWQGTRLVITSASGTSSADLKGDRGIQGIQGEKGDPFFISKVYNSVAEMHADYSNNEVKVGQFVVIETGNVNDEDNAKLFIKGNTSYEFLTDLSGAQGMQGPAGVQGETGPAGAQGVGIRSIAKTDTQGIQDIYTITLSDGRTATFSVTNGTNGNDGVSVTNASIDSNGNLVISLSNGNELSLGKVVGSNGKDGADGTSVTIERINENTSDGGSSTIFFSDGNSINIKNGATGGKGADGKNGTSVTITKVTESTEDGGNNVVTFSDGKTLNVKNGKDGHTPVKGVDYYTDVEKAEWSEYIASELAKRGQLKPEYANSVEECTDTTKLYVLPDGFIYAYMYKKGEGKLPDNLVTTSLDKDGVTVYNGVGYKDGAYVSDSGNYGSASGIVAAGYIEYKCGEPIYIKGVTLDTSNSRVRIYFTEAIGGTDRCSASGGSNGGTISQRFTVEELGTNYYKLTPNDAFYERFNYAYADGVSEGDTVYYRLSAVGTGANLFISHNVPIEETTTSGYQWANTGHAFVPADYEDIINDLADRTSDLENRVDELSVGDNGTFTYVAQEAKRVADLVQAKRTVGSLTFTAMSDTHVEVDTTVSSYPLADNLTSCRDAGLGLSELQKYLKLDFAAMLGDYTWGDKAETVAQVKKDLTYVKRCMTDGMNGIPNIWCTGNHDINYGENSDRRMTEDELYAYLTSNNKGTIQDGDNIGRNYGYIDFENQKIRCIYLNTVDVLGTSNTSGVTTAQTTWLSNVGLNFTDKANSSQWGVVILSHHCISGASFSSIVSALAAHQDKIICAIHGHNHNFIAKQINGWLWSICVPNVDTIRNNEAATSTDTAWREAYGEFDASGNPVYYPKTQGTAKSTSFCVITIDRKNRKVHAIAYGAGIDREIGY